MPARVSVLGAGNGGCAIAADLVRRGIACTLFDLPRFEAVVAPIREAGVLRLTGVLGDVTVRAPPVTTDIREAVEDADVLLVAVPAFAQVTFAEACAPFLREGQVVVLTPGSTGRCARRRGGPPPGGAPRGRHGGGDALAPVRLPEGRSGPRPRERREARPPGRGLPGDRERTCGRGPAQGVFPAGLAVAANVLETSLNNLNAMAHPLPALLNAGWIETTGGDFRFYNDGVSPSVARAMDAARPRPPGGRRRAGPARASRRPSGIVVSTASSATPPTSSTGTAGSTGTSARRRSCVRAT